MDKTYIGITPEPCPTHKRPDMSYNAWFSYAERRTKMGHKQRQCPVCGRWYFKNEF